jgi:hypothetical protein
MARPYQSVPLGMDVSFIHNAKICGRAPGAATRGVGHGFGDFITCVAPISVPFSGSEHAEMANIIAKAAEQYARFMKRDFPPKA